MTKPFHTKVWTLAEGVQSPPETWVRPGKTEWPDMVTVRWDRRAALRMLQSLANQLASNDEGEDVEVVLFGELKRDED